MSDTSSSCSPTPNLSNLPGAASAVLAPRPGGSCWFFFLTRPPSSHHHCNTRANPDSTAGSIKRAVQAYIWVACCFRFLTRPPSSHHHCNTRANPDSTAGSIKRAVQVYLWATAIPRECGYATQPKPMCHGISNLTDEIYLLRDFTAEFICCPAIGAPSEISQSGATRCLAAHFSRPIHTCTYVHTTAVPPVLLAAGC